MTFSAQDVEDEIRRQLPKQADHEIRQANQEFAAEVADFAKGIAPVRTGAFRDSIEVQAMPDVDGLPASQLRSDIEYANLIEYGTKHMAPRAVFGQTAAHFGGDQQEPQR